MANVEAKKGEVAKKTTKTPAKKAPQSKKQGGFLSSVVVELKKVHWPDRPKVIKYTGVVLGTVIVLGAIMWVVDTGLSMALALLIGA